VHQILISLLFDEKYKVLPSAEIKGANTHCVELILSTKLIGSNF
jgi:hypothetical protein